MVFLLSNIQPDLLKPSSKFISPQLPSPPMGVLLGPFQAESLGKIEGPRCRTSIDQKINTKK